MKRALSILALAAFMAAGAGTACAEIILESSGWESGRIEKAARPAIWTGTERAVLDAKKPGLLRGKVVLKNRGPVAAEGILVRYTVSARLVSSRPGVASEAAWAIPFLVDERRVPKVGPNLIVDVPLSLSPKLDLYLAKLKRLGFKPNALKLQAMIEPHVDAGVHVVESLVDVAL